MSNPFNQFDSDENTDAESVAVQTGGGNTFDQFDAPAAAAGDGEQPTNAFDQFGEGTPVDGDQYAPFAPVREDIDPATLAEDPDWLRASRLVYADSEYKPFEGTDEELAEWGLDHLGYFNYNLAQTGIISKGLVDADQGTKEAFLYMMDTYDNTNVSWGGVGRFFKGVATDPTTYVGLSSLGVGLVGKAAGGVAAKQGVKELLKQGIGRTGVVASVEGGMYAAGDDYLRQGVEVDAGRKEERDGTQTAVATTIGAAASGVLGTAADAGITATRQLFRGSTPTRGQPNAADAPPQGASEEVPGEGAETPAPDVSKLKGRRAADDAEVPEVDPADTIEDVVDLEVENTGQRTTPMGDAEINEAGKPVAARLREMGPGQLQENLEVLRRTDVPMEKYRVIAKGVEQYTSEIKAERAKLLEAYNKSPEGEDSLRQLARLQEIENLVMPLEMADEAISSLTGSLLRQRRGSMAADLRGVSPETIMQNNKVSREEAEGLYIEAVNHAMNSKETRAVAAKYDDGIQKAIDEGDLVKAAELAVLRDDEMGALAGLDFKDNASMMRKINEVAISNVFSATTVMINAVPSAVKTVVVPAVRMVATNPLDAAVRAETGATYSAMRSSMGAAWRAAKASWRYEQSMLTRPSGAGLSLNERGKLVDSGRFLEDGLAIRGAKGGTLRLFPRILNATDEYLSQINYQGYVAGRAAADAYAEGSAAGLKGAELDSMVDERIAQEIRAATSPEDGDEIIQPIIYKGINKGLKGEDLLEYVKKEAGRDPQSLVRGNRDDARNYAEDVLFKRRFSGVGQASGLAKNYEDAISQVPAIKFVLGQLFFRTPVRVFEEGVRMTPGVQFMAPGFIGDLKGDNGTMRQVRARGEAMASFAMTAGIMAMYGEGRLTGDGAYDHWRQKRQRGDTDLPAPYTLRLDDGSTWSYRNFDPIATPVKMIVNTLERMDNLKMRQAQGEVIDESHFKKGMAVITVAAGAIASSIRDANLTAGIDGAFKLGENLSDPEETGAWIKWMGEKMHLMVPNTLTKIARTNDPLLKDPADFWQTLEHRFSPLGVDFEDVKTPYSYDALGNVRSMSDTGMLWNIFSTASEEERGRGRSEKELVVMRELDRLAKETGVNVRVPYTHRKLGNMDLRTVMTGDGEETLYDRWQSNLRSLNVVEPLYAIVNAEMPDGTFKHRAARQEKVTQVLTQYRNAAFDMILANETAAITAHVGLAVDKADAEAGLWDLRRKRNAPERDTVFKQQ